MIEFLLWLLLIYVVYRIIHPRVSVIKQETGSRTTASEGTATHRDPVCGMYVSEEDAVIGKLEGERHYFCSMGCLEKFREQLDHTSRS